MKTKIEASRHIHPRMMTKILLYGYCVGVFFVEEDPEALGGGCRFSSIGSGESAGLPHHLGFSEAAFEGTGRTVPADVTADVRDRDDEVGSGGTGREQGEG